MKTLVFDTGPIISLAMNNLLWTLEPMKKRFKGSFLITKDVKRECVERPLTSKKFKFEAIQVLKLIEGGILEVYEKDVKKEALALHELANSLFKVQGNFIKNVQYAEVESIVAAIQTNAEALVIDEFITRTLIEKPTMVKKRMEKKLHSPVHIDKRNIVRFQKAVKQVKVIRSVELVTVAFELGLFDRYYPLLENPKETLIEALLWALKLNGCSVSENEINEIIKLENPFCSR